MSCECTSHHLDCGRYHRDQLLSPLKSQRLTFLFATLSLDSRFFRQGWPISYESRSASLLPEFESFTKTCECCNHLKVCYFLQTPRWYIFDHLILNRSTGYFNEHYKRILNPMGIEKSTLFTSALSKRFFLVAAFIIFVNWSIFFKPISHHESI